MFTTTKEEAFASPRWAYYFTPAFEAGENALSKEEEILCEAYEELDRLDLAACIRGGRKFHRLHAITCCWRPSALGEAGVLGLLNGLTDAFAVKPDQLPGTLDEWLGQAMIANANDPDLSLMVQRNEDAKIWQKQRTLYDNNPFIRTDAAVGGGHERAEGLC